MRDNSITRMAAVTPSNTANLPTPGIGLYVGVSGNVKAVTSDGYTETMVGLAAGVWHPIQCKQIFDTGTTATDILVGW